MKEPSHSRLIMAAQYVRMSTEQQQYSTANQMEAIRAYAEQRDMVIVRTYTDAGKSGLTLSERGGLRQLLADAERGSPGYAVVLVYDVSRWGRFQDTDESAYYEYRCRRANIAVHYCAETFSNDGGVMTALLKALKRAMAAEYSRELSVKVFAGKARLIEMGFRQGGLAGYGFRRLLVDQHGKPKFVLKSGEQKSIATDRIVLIPGPPEEIEIVNEIFRMYISKKYAAAEIARTLNERGVPWVDGRPWTRHIIREMVSNPKYIGTNVSSRRTSKLRTRSSKNPPEMWIKRDHAFSPLVDAAVYAEAQLVAKSRAQRCSEEELLQYLRDFLAKNGTLSARKINADLDMPCPQAYTQRFGSLMSAYKKIGHVPNRNMAYLERDRDLFAIRRGFTALIIQKLREFGASASFVNQTKLIHINGTITVRAIVTRYRIRENCWGWLFRLYSPTNADFTVIARLAPGNKDFLDYYCLPRNAFGELKQVTIRAGAQLPLREHVFQDLGFLSRLAGKMRTH